MNMTANGAVSTGENRDRSARPDLISPTQSGLVRLACRGHTGEKSGRDRRNRSDKPARRSFPLRFVNPARFNAEKGRHRTPAPEQRSPYWVPAAFPDGHRG